MDGEWCYSFDGERFFKDDLETKEQAIEKAKKEARKVNAEVTSFYVGVARQPKCQVGAECVAELIQEEFYDQCGEWADNWDPNKESIALLQTHLNYLIHWWLKETKNEPTFFTVEYVEEIDIEEGL